MEWLKENRSRAAAAVVALAAVVVVVVLVAGGDGGGSKAKAGEAEIVSANDLRRAAALSGTSVYWAGERAGTELELSRPGGGRAYVRYLTGGAEAGDPRPDFLTVGTYAQPAAVQALRRQGRRTGGVLAKAPGGAVVYFDRRNPHSVYLAYPGSGIEVEVYDPSFKTALRLVDAGRIGPVD